jgi:hypothetical protein
MITRKFFELAEMKLYTLIIEADLLSFLQHIFLPIPDRGGCQPIVAEI